MLRLVFNRWTLLASAVAFAGFALDTLRVAAGL